jgi:hypothetical protein
MAQTYFSIITSDNAFSMDASLSVNRTLPSTVTEFPVEDGGFVTDNVVNKGDIITLTGIITDIKSAVGKDNLSTSDFISAIEGIRNAKSLVSINVGLDGTGFRTINSCIITSASFNQDGKHGVASGITSSYKVSLSFKKVRIIAAATQETRETAVVLKDLTIVFPETAKDVPVKEDTSPKTDPKLEARRRALAPNSLLSTILGG